MPDLATDVLCIGNAIVDVIAAVDNDFLLNHAMSKGGMALIDEARADAIYVAMGPGVQASGGSAGNTAAGIASLGGRAAYVGKVKRDSLGDAYRRDIMAQGVRFDTLPTQDGVGTARCLILVTPDAQRTMNTFLGACVNLSPADIDPAQIAAASIVYLEGYLYDPPAAKEAFHTAAAIARAAGRKVALSLSDSFCVARYRDEFRALIANHVDILFANDAEITALYGLDHLDAAIEAVSGQVGMAAVTIGARGSVIVTGSERIDVPPVCPAQLVDTTGAGDLYAAGVLHGLSLGLPLAGCGHLGSIAAAEIISHVGARPQVQLASLVNAL